MSENDLITIIENESEMNADQRSEPWRILIADDEDQVHSITELVLTTFKFDNRGLQFLNAYSAKEARALFQEHDNIAVAFVDVVMETDAAGLELIDFVRNHLGNHYSRLILRTGQPGYAPETEVIQKYDIDDYKCKSDLTDIKLVTTLYSALRSYRDIIRLVNHRNCLQQVIDTSQTIYKLPFIDNSQSVIFKHFLAIISIATKYQIVDNLPNQAFVAAMAENNFQILEATKRFDEYKGILLKDFNFLEPSAIRIIDKAIKNDFFAENHFEIATICTTSDDKKYLFYARSAIPFRDSSKQLIEIFNSSIRVALENLFLHGEIDATQHEIVYLLGESIECRSIETGNHVKRVAEVSYLLALEFGFSQQDAEILKLASPLHDLGKIAIPDHILHKNGALNEQEQIIMRDHVTIGYRLLRNSKRPVLQAAAIIAHQHHEKWDGTGYPQQLKGEEIHPFGRITALTDVFDALMHERSYKKPWPLKDAVAFINGNSGTHFDPMLVDIFNRRLNDILQINRNFPDHESISA